MKQIAWITDIHLNFLSQDEVTMFLGQLDQCGSDAILIGGDIGEAQDVVGFLGQIETRLQRPIFFVLGNHDFYGGSIYGVRSAVRELCENSDYLSWLPDAGVVEVEADTAVVGHDGWADGWFGDYQNSPVMLNDYILIEDFKGLDKDSRLQRMRSLGEEASHHFRKVLPAALHQYQQVFLLTHVPPFREASWHEGGISDDDWIPHFTCKAVGEVLVEIMKAHPNRELTVLCGHTHGEGEAQILENLRVLTGGAKYGVPAIQQVFDMG